MDQTEFIEFVEEILEVGANTIAISDKLGEIEWDSLANITFIAEVDSKFGVSLDAERLGKSETVSELYELLKDAIRTQ